MNGMHAAFGRFWRIQPDKDKLTLCQFCRETSAARQASSATTLHGWGVDLQGAMVSTSNSKLGTHGLNRCELALSDYNPDCRILARFTCT